MPKLIDITDLTDAALDALLDNAAQGYATVEHLTVAERQSLATALDWPQDARTRAWVVA